MATFKPGGYGAEHYGDPFGGGGPLHVVRALAVSGQTIRVVFDEEPKHFSAAASDDGLNPFNYQIAVVTGQAEAPLPIGVDDFLVTGPALGVQGGTDERALDLRVDRPLIVGIRYRVTARRTRARAGGDLGAPYSAEFMGVVRVKAARTPARKKTLVDFAVDPVTGFYVVDDSGDIAVQEGLDSLKKRILRRWTTPRGSYSFLPKYGVGLRLKNPVPVAELGPLQRELLSQAKLEPEVEAASVTVSIVPLPGVLSIDGLIRAKQGSITIGLTVMADGRITFR